jgi:hypothetical protein
MSTRLPIASAFGNLLKFRSAVYRLFVRRFVDLLLGGNGDRPQESMGTGPGGAAFVRTPLERGEGRESPDFIGRDGDWARTAKEAMLEISLERGDGRQ